MIDGLNILGCAFGRDGRWLYCGDLAFLGDVDFIWKVGKGGAQ